MHTLAARPLARSLTLSAALSLLAAPLYAEQSQSSASSNGSSGSSNPLSVSTSGDDAQRSMSTQQSSAASSQQTTAESGVASSQSTVIVLGLSLVVLTTTGLTVGLVITFASNNQQLGSFELYLQDNRVALYQSLTLGAGDAMQDLADAFDIPVTLRARFGLLLRRHSAPLLALLDRTRLSADDARAFALEVLRILATDTALGPPLLTRATASWTLSIHLPDSHYALD